MLKFAFLAFISILSVKIIYAQNVKLSGYILDQKTGEALIGATLTVENSAKGCITNNFGYFNLLAVKDDYQLHISYIGYLTKTLNLKLFTDTILNIGLLSDSYKVDEIIINKTLEKKIEERTEIGKVRMPISLIKLLPSITGESDILKAYQFVPGIQNGNELNNGLFIRGGTPDQNLFLLDDVPLYNVSHIGGLFSIFDPSMVKSIDLYKGGFPARYGGRISSVADVRNKDGNLYDYKYEVGISLFLSKLFIEGPVIKGKSSFAFSIRRSNLDIYTFLYNRMLSNHYNQGYVFYDINLKWNLKLSQNNRIFTGLYFGKDKFYFKEKDVTVENAGFKYSSYSDLLWGNKAASIRWLHITKHNIFNNLTFAFTDYYYINDNQYSRTELSDNTIISSDFKVKSGVRDLIIKNDLELLFEKTKIRFGISGNSHYYIPTSVIYANNTQENSNDSQKTKNEQSLVIKSQDISGYLELEYKIFSKLNTNIGARQGLYFIDSKSIPFFEPRVVINYQFIKSVSLKGSYSKMSQSIHLLTNSNAGLPSDIWVPSTTSLKPETSKQLTFGIFHTTTNNYEISIEVYYKILENLIEYKEGILIYSNDINWEDKVEKGGIGKSKGYEFMINKKTGSLSGWFGYTLSYNNRVFNNINHGRAFPFKYEQRHNLNIVAIYEINKKIGISGTWTYHTGNHITLPTSKYMLYNINYTGSYEGDRSIYNDIHIYSEKNGYIMPNYHRLDIGFTYTKIKKKGVAKWNISIYNAYNRQNAYYLYFKISDDGTAKLYQQSLFPILVNFGYTFIFNNQI